MILFIIFCWGAAVRIPLSRQRRPPSLIKFQHRFALVRIRGGRGIDIEASWIILTQLPAGLRKALSCLERVGWRILRKALASICRIRSRVTLNSTPTSSNVFGLPSSRPKRWIRTLRSRSVKVASTSPILSLKIE